MGVKSKADKPVIPKKASEIPGWEQAIANLMSGDEGASARLAFLSLAHVRQKIGDEEFVRISDRIHLAIQTIIGKLLGSEDQILRVGEETYVILVRSMEFEKAEKLIEEGCEALARLFFGEGQLDDLTFTAEVTEVLPLGTNATPRRFEISASVKDPKAKVVDATPQTKPLKHSTVPIKAGRSTTAQWRPMAAAVRSAEDLELNFVPTWDASKKVLSTFAAGEWVATADGQFEDKLATTAGKNYSLLAEYDAQVIRQTTDIVCELFRNAFALLVLLPVHYRALTSPAGGELISSALHDVPEHMRRLFTIDILGTPQDMSHNLLADKLNPLKALGYNIILSIDTWNAATAKLVGCTGVDVAALFLPPGGQIRERLLGDLKEFSATVRGIKKIPAIVQVHNKQEIKLAVQAGITYLTGTGVGMPEDLPGNMVRCAMEELPYGAKKKTA